jgi:hypothetical protein
MATEEQLKVTIQTVADTAAVERYGRAMQQVQQQGQQSSRVAEAAARATAFQRAGGMEAALRGAAAGPAGGGTGAAAVETTRRLGAESRVTASEMVRLGAAAVGLGVGLSAFTLAGNIAHAAFSRIIDDTIALDHAMRLNTITLGNQAANFQQFAAALSQQSGFTQRSLLEAGTAAEQFGRQLGLVPQQVQELVGVSAQLAQVLGTDVGQTMTLLTAAMQGNAQAANSLGLNLDDAYVAYTELGGASAEVFKQLDPGTQATLRYQAALKQVADITKTMPGPVQDLQKAQNQLNTEWERFALTIGPGVVGMLAGILGGVSAISSGVPEAWGNFADALNKVVAGRTGIQLWQDFVDFNNTKLNKPGIELIQDTGQAVLDWHESLMQSMGGGDVSAQIEQTATAIAHVSDAQDRAAASAANLTARNALGAARGVETQLTTERVRLQHEQVDLTAEQARMQLSMLPTQEHMAALQRDMTEQQVRARQAALPSSEALENLQYQEQVLRLQLQARGLLSPEERAGARRQLRGLARAEPGVALTALEAGRPVTLAGRAATRLGMEAQLQDLATQRALAPVQGAQQQNQLVAAIVAAQLQAVQQYIGQMTVVVNLQIGDKTQQFLTQADLHAGVQAASNSASNQLAGAG